MANKFRNAFQFSHPHPPVEHQLGTEAIVEWFWNGKITVTMEGVWQKQAHKVEIWVRVRDCSGRASRSSGVKRGQDGIFCEQLIG